MVRWLAPPRLRALVAPFRGPDRRSVSGIAHASADREMVFVNEYAFEDVGWQDRLQSDKPRYADHDGLTRLRIAGLP